MQLALNLFLYVHVEIVSIYLLYILYIYKTYTCFLKGLSGDIQIVTGVKNSVDPLEFLQETKA